MKMHSKIHVFIYSICLLSFHWTTHAVSSRFLDDVSSTDVNAVRIRLSEEKSKRLLLQNDIETLMGKVEELERKLNGRMYIILLFLTFVIIRNIWTPEKVLK